MSIISIRHPDYTRYSGEWETWRLTYSGGKPFLDRFLIRYSRREDTESYRSRIKISPIPTFAKAAVNDIRNSVYNRAVDIIRENGSINYQASIYGLLGGVDLADSSMSFFIGQDILTELLTMSRVGIYVDMPVLENTTKAALQNKHPYLYYYKIEDILSWKYDKNQLVAILLRDNGYTDSEEANLPLVETYSYRYLSLEDGEVKVTFFDKDGADTGNQTLSIDRIPFVMPRIPSSLLADVCSYQIALMNLASSDVYSAVTANFPFYTEQYEFATISPNLQGPEGSDEVSISPTQGRRYPKGVERPGFINPSPDPLKVSMELQKNLKDDIRLLVNLALSNLQPRVSSANFNESLEAGLSYLGQVLEKTEQEIANIWALYEGSVPARVIYPSNYRIVDPEQNREDINLDLKLINSINSPTYRRVLAKRIVRKDIGTEVSAAVLDDIADELDATDIVIADPDTIRSDFEAGLVSPETASLARGYPPGDVERANIAHAERLFRIAAMQSKGGAAAAARGVADLSADPNESRLEKAASRNTDSSESTEVPVRGNGKGVL
jgi:hypothetical protein